MSTIYDQTDRGMPRKRTVISEHAGALKISVQKLDMDGVVFDAQCFTLEAPAVRAVVRRLEGRRGPGEK